MSICSAALAQSICFAQPKNPAPGQVWNDPVSHLDFCYCPPGTFTMGTDASDPYVVKDQMPQHPVTISKGFWLGRTEVPQAAWKARMGANPAKFPGADRPVEMVSWEDCQNFLQKLNQAAGSSVYRLPTEAEWEYACKAGSPDPGEQELNAIAWYKLNSDLGTAPVGRLRANAWGLFDMLGNVREWCSDWRGPYAPDPVTDPQGNPSDTYRINRGGSWFCRASVVRRAYRWYYTPDFRDNDLGFRVLRVSSN